MTASSDNHFDVVIAGGGLAGLSLSILLAEKGHHVAVIEKSEYPRQKVCGEFLSETSKPFLEHLGIYPEKLELPVISRFRITSTSGNSATCNLKTKGLGISRLKLDTLLAETAKSKGVTLFTRENVDSISSPGNKNFVFCVKTRSRMELTSFIVVDARGRSVSSRKPEKSKNDFVGIKYHISTDFPSDLIEIHGFNGGYCGLSKVEEDKYCLCYLTHARELKKHNSKPENFEKSVLAGNPFLADRLRRAEKTDGPVTTSQMHFGSRPAVLDGVLAAGDASGFIPPITGNGMSLAFQSANALAPQIDRFLVGGIDRPALEKAHKDYHRKRISKHIGKGIMLQNLFMADYKIINMLLFTSFNSFPGLMHRVTDIAFGDEIVPNG